MRLLSCIVFTTLSITSIAQSGAKRTDFSITLERTGCVGSCPDYKVTVSGTGAVLYEGRWYVRTKGVHRRTIPVSVVQSLIQQLRDAEFFQWNEGETLCVDYPETKIMVSLSGRKKQVVEGCSSPGKILDLAAEIDQISGAKTWVGHTSSP